MFIRNVLTDPSVVPPNAPAHLRRANAVSQSATDLPRAGRCSGLLDCLLQWSLFT